MDDNIDAPISAEEEAIWNQEEDPSFAEIRASLDEDETNTGGDEDESDTEEEVQDEETDEEVDEDNMEQSEDSDSDIDVEDEVEDTEETEEVVDTEDDQTDEVETEDETEDETKAQTFKVKANGMEFDFTQEELMQLAPKAMDYTKKMQEIAPWRKTISALKEEGLSEEDLNLAIDVLKGDKDAMAAVMKRTGVEALDLDTDIAEYKPNQYGKDASQLAIEDVVNTISADPEYRITQTVVDSTWDNASRNAMAQDPSMISGLHNDIKSGVYDKVAPMALKMKALDGGRQSDLDYYIAAGDQYFNQVNETANTDNVEVKAERTKTVKQASKKRKAAGITKSKSGQKSVIDYLDDSNDEKFDDWYKKLQANH